MFLQTSNCLIAVRIIYQEMHTYSHILSVALNQIRDGTHPRADFNMTTSLLMTCKSQVIYPYFYILSLVSYGGNKNNIIDQYLRSIQIEKY